MCVVTNICMSWRNPKPCNHLNDTTTRDANCIFRCSDTPFKPRVYGKGVNGTERNRICSWLAKDEKDLDNEEQKGESTKNRGINKSLDDKEVEKEGQEEEDEKKHYLVEVDDEKGAEDDGELELDDEGHGKDLNKIMSK